MSKGIDFSQLNGNALFRVKSKKRLAEILQIDVTYLKKLVESDDLYKCWTEVKKNGGTRSIEAPRPPLKKVQKRIAHLLQSIITPDYLMAPVKARSYVTNAAFHRGSKSFKLLDIKDFYPSCTEKKVFWFFNKCMDCSEDVSAILAAISTRNGKLPQGSPCSPILAFYAYIDMWNKIDNVLKSAGNKLSVYVDDITISGEKVLKKTVWLVKEILHTHGHKVNPEKERSIIKKTVEITGVILSGNKLLVPNRQHKKLHDDIKELSSVKSQKIREQLSQKIRGRSAQANQIKNYAL